MNFFGIISVADWFLALLLGIVAFYIYATWNYGFFEKQGLKTDHPLPLLGNILSRYFNKHIHLEDQKAYYRLGNVHGVYEGRQASLVMGDPEMIKQVLVKNFTNFINRRPFVVDSESKLVQKFLSAMEGEEWRATRHVLSPAFTTGKLKQMGHLMEECAFNGIKDMREKLKSTKSKILDIKTEFSLYTMNVIASCAFGLQANCNSTEDPIFQHSKAIFATDFSWKFAIILMMPSLARMLHIEIFPSKSLQYLKNVCKDVMGKRKVDGNRRPDFLQLLLDAQNEEKNENKSNGNTPKNGNNKIVLDELCLIAQAILFIVAGFEAASSIMSHVTYFLALNPQCYKKLIDEIEETKSENNGNLSAETIMQMPYLDMVLSETLRINPLATRAERVCTNDTMVGNIMLKKGMVAAVPIYALHHDEKYFPDPEIFDPERFSPENKDSINPYAYLPFGAGPRNCIGMRFAQMQSKIGLAHYLDSFQFNVSLETEIPLQLRKGLPQLTLLNGLKLQVQERI